MVEKTEFTEETIKTEVEKHYGMKVDDIKVVNVGGMRFDPSKKQVTEAVSVTPEDVAAFKKLHELGVELELRQLPGDSKQDFMKILDTKLG